MERYDTYLRLKLRDMHDNAELAWASWITERNNADGFDSAQLRRVKGTLAACQKMLEWHENKQKDLAEWLAL